MALPALPASEDLALFFNLGADLVGGKGCLILANFFASLNESLPTARDLAEDKLEALTFGRIAEEEEEHFGILGRF